MHFAGIGHWNGQSLGAGPIAIVPYPALQTSTGGTRWPALVAWAASLTASHVVTADQLERFLADYADTQFVCAGVDQWYWQLHDALSEYCGEDSARQLRGIVEQSRLIDLYDVGQLLRYARGQKATDVAESLDELARTWRVDPDMSIAAAEGPEGRRLRTLLAVYSAMLPEIEAITKEATATIEPALFASSGEPHAEQDDPAHQEFVDNYLRYLKARRLLADSTSASVDFNPTVEDEDEEAVPAAPNGPLGAGLNTRGIIALAQRLPASGLQVDRFRVAELLLVVQDEYRRASAVLAEDAVARTCFQWDKGDVALNEIDYPTFNGQELHNWLQRESRELYDQFRQSPPFVDEHRTITTTNLEYWGAWAGCARSVWACRQLFRMAELRRLHGRECVEPRYELLPAFRSLEPNLAVYRTLRVPVFRPNSGNVFLAGRVQLRTAYCLTAACIRSGYVLETRARLPYLLSRPDPLEAAARDLYVAKMFADEALARDDKPAAVETTDEFGVGERYRAEFDLLRQGAPEKYEYWLGLTLALLETSPLGLPSELLTPLLRNEFGLDELKEPEVRRFVELLGSDVVYELKWFLHDDVFRRVATREGITIQEAYDRYHYSQEPERSDAILRRRQPNARAYRRLTLGGRPTMRVSPAVVRQQELLLAADEVMLEVAWALSAAGYNFKAIAGSEFLVEVDAGLATRACLEDVATRASAATKRVLGEFSASVVAKKCDRW